MQKILIVEDDADLVETYTDFLEAHNYTVASVARANEAIGQVISFRPRVVLLDLNLAGYSGTVVINIVRRYQFLSETKIVVVTGHPEMLAGNANASRVDYILSKPVSNEQLLQTISQLAPSPTP